MIRRSLLGVLRDMRHDSGEVTVAFPIPTRYRLFSLSEAESLWKSEYTAMFEVISSAESNNVMFMYHPAARDTLIRLFLQFYARSPNRNGIVHHPCCLAAPDPNLTVHSDGVGGARQHPCGYNSY